MRMVAKIAYLSFGGAFNMQNQSERKNLSSAERSTTPPFAAELIRATYRKGYNVAGTRPAELGHWPALEVATPLWLLNSHP